VQAVLGGRSVLRIERKEVVWDEQNTRWETAVGAVIRLTACKPPPDSQVADAHGTSGAGRTVES
jgi:hypothetical protein